MSLDEVGQHNDNDNDNDNSDNDKLTTRVMRNSYYLIKEHESFSTHGLLNGIPLRSFGFSGGLSS